MMKAEMFCSEAIYMMQVLDNKGLNMGCWQKEWKQEDLGKYIKERADSTWCLDVKRGSWRWWSFEPGSFVQIMEMGKLRVAFPMGLCFFSFICKYGKDSSSARIGFRPAGKGIVGKGIDTHHSIWTICPLGIWGMLPLRAVVGSIPW